MADPLQEFSVKVLDDGGERVWKVQATSRADAFQIAFLLDGGWNMDGKPEEHDDKGLLALAAMHCSICESDDQPKKKCPQCEGDGCWQDVPDILFCERCGGTGKVLLSHD